MYYNTETEELRGYFARLRNNILADEQNLKQARHSDVDQGISSVCSKHARLKEHLAVIATVKGRACIGAFQVFTLLSRFAAVILQFEQYIRVRYFTINWTMVNLSSKVTYGAACLF